MALLTARVMAVALLLAPAGALAQRAAPTLSKDQRAALLAVVTAVRQNDAPASDDGRWQVHRFRASDGSHYVAFSAPAPDGVTPDTPLLLYVRMASRPPSGAAVTTRERSAVEEWLEGQRTDPLPKRAGGVVQVPSGEIPIGIPGRDGAGQNSAVLALIEKARERERAEKERKEREKREEMAGRGGARDLLPFEDFDVAARAVASAAGPAIRRAVTAGPGDYDLFVGWATVDAKGRPQKVGVLRREVTLPAVGPGELSLGSIVLADDVHVRTDIVGADQQTAHPYAIGSTEIAPAADDVFTNDERVTIAFQVMGAAATPAGKPDVTVSFRLFRLTGSREEAVGTLSPLQYNDTNLPVDFDLTQGHPILAAMAAPLRTLPRGQYRLAITAADRIARTSATGETRFRIVGTPQSLLRAAPPYAPPFVRAAAIAPDALRALTELTEPLARSATLAHMQAAAAAGRFTELLPDVAFEPAEAPVGTLLRGLGFYGVGDGEVSVSLIVKRALDMGAPAGPGRFLLGACLAAQGRDRDAVIEWNAARDAGMPAGVVAWPLAQAHVRLGETTEARAVASQALAAGNAAGPLARLSAAMDIAAGQYPEAIARLEPVVAASPDDLEARWLVIHARFALFAAGNAAATSAEARASLAALLSGYIDAGGANKALADEWKTLVTASSAAGGAGSAAAFRVS